MTQASWRPIAADRVGARVRAEILRILDARGLSPGDRLPSERELAALLRVSRPSVREAVRVLEAEGRLEVHHGRGVFVAEPLRRADALHGPGDLPDLYLMREALDVPAALWAAERQDRVGLAVVAEALAALDAAWAEDPADGVRLRSLDAAFHLAIARAAGNRFLTQAADVLTTLVLQGMEYTWSVPTRRRDSPGEHRRILDALLAADGAAAARAAREHVRNARDAALGRSTRG